MDGRIVGQHEGVIHYTIGQRKGLGIGGGVTENNDPLYVIGINAGTADVIVGPKEALARDVVYIGECNWLDNETELDVMVKLRSATRATPARLVKSKNNEAALYLETSQYGISSGQAAVCYSGDRVIGGGWIISSRSKSSAEAA